MPTKRGFAILSATAVSRNTEKTQDILALAPFRIKRKDEGPHTAKLHSCILNLLTIH